MNVQLDAELVMELRADCPEEDRTGCRRPMTGDI